jgi:hypothetical protein
MPGEFSQAQNRLICRFTRPSSSELVVNLKTAKALDITSPFRCSPGLTR